MATSLKFDQFRVNQNICKALRFEKLEPVIPVASSKLVVYFTTNSMKP